MLKGNDVECEQFHECVSHNSQVRSCIGRLKVAKDVLNLEKHEGAFGQIERLFQFLGGYSPLFLHFEENSEVGHHLNPDILQNFNS